jgi:hypothetical protein
MIVRRLTRLTTAAALAATLTGLGVATASAAAAVTSFPCSASGEGSTLSAAVQDARANLIGDYTVLGAITLAYDTQNADGSWYAVVSSRCGNPR